MYLLADVNDLQNFVTIALATAAGGEDDFTRDRLSYLCTVGEGFAALIYKLPQDTGYKELERRCNSLWEALHQDKKLPDLMVNCRVINAVASLPSSPGHKLHWPCKS